jgi:hypothetical protein
MDQHTAACSRCAGIKRSLDQMKEYVGYLRQEEPRMAEPDLLTGSILNSVHTLEEHRRQKVTGSAVDFFWNILSIPKIRLILTGMVFLIAGSFFMQEFLVLNRLSRLEEKIARQTPPVGGSRSIVLNTTKRIQKITDLEKFKTLLVSDKDESGLDEWVLIHRSALESLIAANTRLHDTQEQLLDTLTVLLPDLKIISLENGLNAKELKLLRQNKNRIIQTLVKL